MMAGQWGGLLLVDPSAYRQTTLEGRGWELYPPPSPLSAVMAEVGMEEVETYAVHLQNTDVQYITILIIMDLCLEAERRPRERVSKRWLKQVSLDLVGKQAAEARSVETEAEAETEIDTET